MEMRATDFVESNLTESSVADRESSVEIKYIKRNIDICAKFCLSGSGEKLFTYLVIEPFPKQTRFLQFFGILNIDYWRN
jgi:hypothetical protein